MDYIFILFRFHRNLDVPVSSLYGAPLLLKKGGGSHGITLSLLKGFTVIPEFFIPKFLLEAANILQAPALPLRHAGICAKTQL